MSDQIMTVFTHVPFALGSTVDLGTAHAAITY